MGSRSFRMRTFLILICFLVVGGILAGMVLGALGVSDASAHLMCGLVFLLVVAVGMILRWERRGSAGGDA
jgi:hypothetical protein